MWNHLWNLGTQVFPNIVATIVTVPAMFIWHHRRIVVKLLEKIDESREEIKSHVTLEIGKNAEEAGTQTTEGSEVQGFRKEVK